MKKLYILILSFLMFTIAYAADINQPFLKKDIQFYPKSKLNSLLANEQHGLKRLEILNQEVLRLKSLATKQKLDSMVTKEYNIGSQVWKTGTVEKFTYDAQGRNTVYTYHNYNTLTDELEYASKETFSYNSANQITEHHNYQWLKLSNVAQWVEDMKIVYTYNLGGQLIQDVSYSWDDDLNELVLTTKGTYTYNASGKVTSMFMYSWDTDWVPTAKYEYTYNASGKISIMEYSMFYNDSWVLFTKELYTYNGQGQLTELLTTSLNFLAFSMENSKKEVSTYNAAGDNTSTTAYKWVMNAWVNDWKDEATFDLNHRELTTKESSWKSELSTWNVDHYTEYTYAANGDLASMIHKRDETPGVLINYGKDEITYNNSYTTSDIIYPYYFGDVLGTASTHMFTLLTTYGWGTGGWSFDEKTTFYYSPITITTNPSIADGNIQIYPNPVNERLNVVTGSDKPSQLSISGLDGRLLKSHEFTHNISIETSSFPRGIYLIQISTSGRPAYQGKIVVQ